ncbi:alpha/beta fold hydrolase [Sphingopyxis indica]|uniref:alpha/beta fold hydrolase n=1 Tax=Sphingopyxis indica TaxID=436663 RepID=UPI000B77E254|nr:hypothetical protein [Sphingopyxis indica]
MPAKAIAGAALLVLAGCAPGQEVAGAAPHGNSALQEKLFAKGVKRFIFSDWAGPALPVWTYRAAGTPADAPVLFIFHGALRDADNYVDQWLDLARRYKIVLIVPEFSKASFPGARSYSHGWFTEKDGMPRPPEKWSFAVVEPIFAEVRAREALNAQRYSLYGHSGGAQFVHRFILAGGGPHMARAVSANAGSYAMTDPAVKWPFGLAGLPEGLWHPKSVFALPVTVLLGTEDIDPHHHSLPRQPEAMAQGPYRLARGQTFYARARAVAKSEGVPFAWTCGLVRGVGHDNGGMAPVAVRVLFGKTALAPGADCAPVEEAR